MSVGAVGGFGLFYYPPAFLPLILPFGVLDPTLATWAWTGLLLLAFGVGVAILPVSEVGQMVDRPARRPVLAIRLLRQARAGRTAAVPDLCGRDGAGWTTPLGLGSKRGDRDRDQDPARADPGLAVLTGRWRAAVIGVLLLVMLSIAGAAVAGASSWTDFLTLMRQLVDPIGPERNMSPGAVLFRLGVSTRTSPARCSSSASWSSWCVVVVAAFRATAEASYLVAVTASQLLVAGAVGPLCNAAPAARGVPAGRSAVAGPCSFRCATSTLLTTVTPPIVYPIASS